MNVRVIHPHDLTDALTRNWRQFQDDDSTYSSAYFDPSFAMLAANSGRKVRIALIEDGSLTVGFFPFELTSKRAGRPVAGALSDFQGIVSKPGTDIEIPRLIKNSEIRKWEFDHLVDPEGRFGSFVRSTSSSPAIDISMGFRSYIEQRKLAGTKKIAQVQRKRRQLERYFGTIQYERRCIDMRILRQLMIWKSEQCLRTGTVDYFKIKWVVDFIDRIFFTRTRRFSGILSTLYGDDKLLAAHMGMLSRDTWHWWFPVYNHHYAKFSPGAVLLFFMVEDAACLGLRRIDLGKGDELFKSQLANTAIPICEGQVFFPSFLTHFLAATRTCMDTLSRSKIIRNTWLGRAARIPVGVIRRHLKYQRYK